MPPKQRVGRPPESDEPKLGTRITKAAANRLLELQDSVEHKRRPRPSQRVMLSALILDMEKRGEDLDEVLRAHVPEA
jgi:hypothetical protein